LSGNFGTSSSMLVANTDSTLERAIDRVIHHEGNYGDFQERMQRATKRAVAEGVEALQTLSRSQLKWIAHDKNLLRAWHHLKDHGGHAPGPDRMLYKDLSRSELFRFLRGIRADINEQYHFPGDYYICEIPKTSGEGFRPIAVENIRDRLVGRAAKQVLEPALDPRFDAFSFGGRPKRSRMNALAVAEELTIEGDHRVWVCQDISDAFGSVPLGPLLEVADHYLLAENVLQLLTQIIRYGKGKERKRRGLLQGNPLSLSLPKTPSALSNNDLRHLGRPGLCISITDFSNQGRTEPGSSASALESCDGDLMSMFRCTTIADLPSKIQHHGHPSGNPCLSPGFHPWPRCGGI
jgi:hypothetical protein